MAMWAFKYLMKFGCHEMRLEIWAQRVFCRDYYGKNSRLLLTDRRF
jgi:hypothetical protein